MLDSWICILFWCFKFTSEFVWCYYICVNIWSGPRGGSCEFWIIFGLVELTDFLVFHSASRSRIQSRDRKGEIWGRGGLHIVKARGSSWMWGLGDLAFANVTALTRMLRHAKLEGWLMALHRECDCWLANAKAWGCCIPERDGGFTNAVTSWPVFFANSTGPSRTQKASNAQVYKGLKLGFTYFSRLFRPRSHIEEIFIPTFLVSNFNLVLIYCYEHP